MISKLKKLIKGEYNTQQKLIISQNEELLWSSIFHDSIRGKKGIENLALNIGRWAGNYSFFYILNRILADYEPKQILEFGLGESSKFVSTYLDTYLLDSNHLIIEQDANWKTSFENKFTLSARSTIEVMPLVIKKYNDFEYNGYESIENKIVSKFDLYIIDGPFGSPNYSRFDVFYLAEKFTKDDEFIIIMDDYQRTGEQQTTSQLLKVFKEKGINIYEKEYKGVKSVKVLGTEKYKYIKSL